eukprot:TRINITY_DN120868_c0_g1_i1.p2 TRINITY_DN120868_c0_g1~~TRINITY_DN120868_c0_g1_i1.p2  ORF type:complete len:326 (-),score=70.65 TRINITY_DN120868_c0_g1_i1:418-1395(-)
MSTLVIGGVGFLILWKAWQLAVLGPASRSAKPFGPRWLAVFVSGLVNKFGNWYLNFSHNTEQKIKEGLFEPGKQYVVVWHPHGAFTITALYFLSHWWAKGYPMKGLNVCVANLLLGVPGLAEYLILCGARSQDGAVFSKLLAAGNTVAVQPGGIPEQVATDAKQERLFFAPKLGFVRLAIKQGCPLLPTYAFGENQLYETSDWVTNINQWLWKNLKVGTLLVWGRGGLLCSPAIPCPLLLPVPGRGLHVAFGDPVDVGPAEADPSDERVKEVFDKYCTALQKLFDENKDKHLPADVAAKGLTITVRSSGKPAATNGVNGASHSKM